MQWIFMNFSEFRSLKKIWKEIDSKVTEQDEEKKRDKEHIFSTFSFIHCSQRLKWNMNHLEKEFFWMGLSWIWFKISDSHWDRNFRSFLFIKFFYLFYPIFRLSAKLFQFGSVVLLWNTRRSNFLILTTVAKQIKNFFHLLEKFGEFTLE